MTTLQEFLNQKYLTEEDREKVKEVNIDRINHEVGGKLGGGELDLSAFPNLEVVILGYEDKLKTPLTKLSIINSSNLRSLDCFYQKISSINLGSCDNLNRLVCSHNNLTSVDFLNNISNPEKMEILRVNGNNIQPTDIEIFSKFVNLTQIGIGTDLDEAKKGKRNQFYGSFQSWKNFTKLWKFCIEDTDIDSGLEYFESNFPAMTCTPHNPNSKVKKIQDELRPFNYDIKAWQLAHPNKMYQARPELFEQPESRQKWLNAIISKIEKTQIKLQETKQNEPDKVKRIKRLESKIRELKLIEKLMEERSIFEDSLEGGVRWYNKFKEDKATQTDLTYLQIIEKK